MKKLSILWLAFSCLNLACAGQADAGVVSSGTITVTQLYVYSEYGNGDVAFAASAGTTGCDGGFWLRPSDPGFKTMYVALMAAYVAKTPLTVAARDDEIWSGSASKFCRVFGLFPS